MAPLSSNLRKSLDKAVVAARDAAESACQAALRALGVPQEQAPLGISDEQRVLRNALRAKQRQLGGDFEHFVSECAYEQWHLMLFARFLAENELLVHPSGAPVTLDEVAELAREEGESDPWLLAARYAAAMLPGIFKTTDPCVRLPLAPEGRRALEDILTPLPSEVFTADDALGWVYQFWQSKKKKKVNASERKIGGADLAPVTQLFTEHYMVRFLLENSLGAWWAARHPDSPLLAEWEYLRFADDGTPASGSFEGWPDAAAEVTVMDPCCGSGHFLVAAFEMLRKMREEEEGLSACEAVDAVLADNLYGLELDPRCIQLAAFALALAAWKLTGYHELRAINLACSGIPTRSSLEEWTKLAKGDARLERALVRLHELFREADTLGSLIDPRRAVEDGTLESVPFEEVAPLLDKALEGDPDPVMAVFNDGFREVAKAATLLTDSYTLVATNVPYLSRRKQSETLKSHCDTCYVLSRDDLATAILERCADLAAVGSSLAVLAPISWSTLVSYEQLRRSVLTSLQLNLVVRLGSQAFSTPMWAFGVGMFAMSRGRVVDGSHFAFLDVSGPTGVTAKSTALARSSLVRVRQTDVQASPSAVISGGHRLDMSLIGDVATVYAGIMTGDGSRFIRLFWEILRLGSNWERLQSTVGVPIAFGGREHIVYWQQGMGDLESFARDNVARLHSAHRRGNAVWGHSGIAISQIGALPVTIYSGDLFDNNVAVLVPKDPASQTAFWAFCRSPQFNAAVRNVEPKLNVTNATFHRVRFNLPHWQKIADEQCPNGLPEPYSDDPTQWLFKGNVVGSEQPLHVALARLLGYRWSDQNPDELDSLADEDGIVCLPAVAGEPPAHERLRQLLEVAYSESFSQQTIDHLLTAEGSATLEDWLRDKAFASHTKLFHNRPFIWHIWDGRKDGFAALVNYHKLGHQTLEKLAFTHLNWWIERQRTDMANGVAGAEARLAAAQELQKKLKLILEGDDPYDIYVRWKSVAEQPLGWEPDLNDGVRLNIRPFVTAGVLRAKVSINWNKDRGKDPTPNLSGTVERHNDLHFTLAEKRAARQEATRRG